MNASESASGIASSAYTAGPEGGVSLGDAASSSGHPQWWSVVTIAAAALPFLTWWGRRRVVSLLVLLSAIASIGNHMTEVVGGYQAIDPLFLGMDADTWLWLDRAIAVLLGGLSILYACQADSAGLWAFGAIGLVLLGICDLSDIGHTNGDAYTAIHATWHVFAYAFVGLIPGQLPVSVDDPGAYFERQRRWQQMRQVPVPRGEYADRADWSSEDPEYPGLYIPRDGRKSGQLDARWT